MTLSYENVLASVALTVVEHQASARGVKTASSPEASSCCVCHNCTGALLET